MWLFGLVLIALILTGCYGRPTPQCIFEDAGFVCNEPVVPVMDSNGVLYGQFQHVQNETIIIKRAAFVEGMVDETDVKCWRDSGNIEIVPRNPTSFKDFTADTTDAGIKGCKADGEALTPTPGSQIRGQLWIEYTYKSDEELGDIKPRFATATVIAFIE